MTRHARRRASTRSRGSARVAGSSLARCRGLPARLKVEGAWQDGHEPQAKLTATRRQVGVRAAATSSSGSARTATAATESASMTRTVSATTSGADSRARAGRAGARRSSLRTSCVWSRRAPTCRLRIHGHRRSRLRYSASLRAFLAEHAVEIKPATREFYENLLEQHLAPYFEKQRLTQISWSSIDSYKKQRPMSMHRAARRDPPRRRGRAVARAAPGPGASPRTAPRTTRR